MNLSAGDLEEIIRFFRRSQLLDFSVLGGEPTLHPDFDRIIDRILAEKEFKSIIVFTNGLISDGSLRYLSSNSDPRLKVAINLNSPRDYTPSQWSRVNASMAALGSRVGLGINIFAPGQEYGYLINAIKKHDLSPHVRLGLTQPILGSNNRYALETDFPAIASDILQFCEESYRSGISCSFDCGFPFCMFSLEQHKKMLQLGVKFRSNCSPIIDIGPDNSVWRCFPLTNVARRKLADFETRNQIVEFYDEEFKSFLPMGNKLECPQCRYRANGLCKGGCLARTLAAFKK
jgi:radical SAM protein with 4Fe4S-binding SPASM domain